jgi:hypothetical protein
MTEQIIRVLRAAAGGTYVVELCHAPGVGGPMFLRCSPLVSPANAGLWRSHRMG